VSLSASRIDIQIVHTMYVVNQLVAMIIQHMHFHCSYDTVGSVLHAIKWSAFTIAVKSCVVAALSRCDVNLHEFV